MRRDVAALFLTTAWASAAAAQVPAGGEFRVNTYTTGRQVLPRVSLDTRGPFVIVWSGNGIFGQRYDAAGAASGAQFPVGQGLLPDVTVGHRGSFLPVWFGGAGDALARLFEADGTPVGMELILNEPNTENDFDAVPATLSNGFVVAWDSNSGGRIGARILDRNGVPAGPEFTVDSPSDFDHAHPAIASSPDSFVVVWGDFTTDAIWGRRFDAAGNALGPQFQVSVSPNPGAFPSVAMAANRSFVVAWHVVTNLDGSGAGVVGRLFAPSGAPIGGEFAVNVYTTGDQGFPTVAADDIGNFVVTWTNYQVNARDVFARRFAASGEPRGGEFQVNTYTTNRQIVPDVDADDVGNFVVTWSSQGQDGSDYGVFAQRFGGLVPAAVAVDTADLPQSDGNGVLEPGEAVDLRPSWRNVNGTAQTFGGALIGLTGPAGATHTITDGSASYGTVAHGSEGACTDCFGVSVSAPPSRPVLHWDATAVESITPDAHGQRKGWKLHVGDSFTDVPRASLYYRFVETLLHNGVTGGCSGNTYCAQGQALREQMPVFVLVAKEGVGYAPRPCTTPMFPDVPASSPYCRWIEELARRGVVSGCGNGNYCASAPVNRQEMPVFVLRTLDPTLDPPACIKPMFSDVPADSPFCPWIEELARRGVVGGCGNGRYCPLDAVTREQMGVFIALGFGLQLYGP